MIEGGRLVYLYVGSADVGRDLAFYLEQLGAELVWRVESGGTEVAAVRLGQGPLVLLADHRPAPGVLPVWAVADLEGEVERLKSAGWTGPRPPGGGPGRPVPGPRRPQRQPGGPARAGPAGHHGTPVRPGSFKALAVEAAP